MTQADNLVTEETVKVEFKVLGEDFVLACRPEDEENLLQAVEEIKQNAAKLLRTNPDMTTLQAAILTALDAQHKLTGYMYNSSPFMEQCTDLVSEINDYSKRISNGF